MTLVQTEPKKIYIRVDVQLVNTPGIYHNAEQGLISLSSDGNTWITIADKNLGATAVYEDGNTLSEANCGKYYQWGNNYGFPFTGAVTTSSTQVNAQNYGPGNYYSSSTFIAVGNNDWNNSYNANLWGGVTGTNEAMQGPCPNGFHVPSINEITNLKNIGVSLGAWSSNGGGDFKTKLKMPYASNRKSANGEQNINSLDVAGMYWSSTSVSSGGYTNYLNFNNSLIETTYQTRTPNGLPIRPFANTPVQPDETWEVLYEYHEPDYLCFTANTAGSKVTLTTSGSPTEATLETSTDGSLRTAYTIGNTITLSNIGDKVYWRNSSTSNTIFSTSGSDYYQFVMTGSIAASGDLNYLLNKNSTSILSDHCFYYLFKDCTALTTPPSLPGTQLADYCYRNMFNGCVNLIALTELPATVLADRCYGPMFSGCSKIKLSTTQTGEYQTPYRIPTTGTGILVGTNHFTNMFVNTGGTFTGTPTVNTTYYTSNTLV